VRLDPAILEFAEAPERFVEIPPDIAVERLVDRRRCILRGTTWVTVTAINVRHDQIDELVEDVRSAAPPDCESLWHIGPSSRPDDLMTELPRRGLSTPAHRASETRALALTTEPDGPSGVEVRRVETFEQFVAAREISWEAFGSTEERRERERGELGRQFGDMVRTGLPVEFIAWHEGALAGSAVAVPSPRGVFLAGGSVAPWARGKGLYRALVRARWEYAAERGAPVLVTHANPTTSYPTLIRLGFEDVGTIRRLEDPTRLGSAHR
jgi:predicted N-acetyltransferase YhbS